MITDQREKKSSCVIAKPEVGSPVSLFTKEVENYV